MNCRWSCRAQQTGKQLQNEVQGIAYPLIPGQHVQATSCRRVDSWHHCSVGTSGGSKSSSNQQAHAAAVTANELFPLVGELLLPVVNSKAWLDRCNGLSSPLQLQQQQQQQHLEVVTTAETGHHVASSSNDARRPSQQLKARHHGGDGIPSSSYGTGSQSLQLSITQSIKSCANWQELDILVQEYGPAFNHIHISAAITHLAQLNSSRQRHTVCQQQEAPGADMQLVHGLESITQRMARQYEQVQRSLGKQQQRQQRAAHAAKQPASMQHGQQLLLQQLLGQAVLRLPGLQSRQVANIMWSLAQLQYHWQASEQAAARVTALLDRAAGLFGAAEGRHLASMAYAAAKLQLPVSSDWVKQLQDAWLRHVQQCKRQNKYQQQQPGQAVDGQCINNHGKTRSSTRCSRQAGQVNNAEALSPQAAANLLWALSHLQQQEQPSQVWLQQVVDGLVPGLQQWPAKSVAMFLWSYAKLGYVVASNAQQEALTEVSGDGSKQQQHVSCLLVQALHQHSHTFSCQDIAQVLWAAAVMRLQLPGPLLHQLVAAGTRHLHAGQQHQQQQHGPDSVQLSSSPTSSQDVRSTPAAVPAAPGSAAVAQSVSLVLWSLARLGVAPRQQLPPRLLKPWLEALVASCPAADSQSLATAAWALCHMQLVGSCPRVVQAMVQSATQSLQQQHELGQPAVAAAITVSGRAIASLLWAAAHCYQATAEAGRTSDRQQQHNRQQQRLQLLLQSLQAPPVDKGRPSNSTQSALTASSHAPGTAEALQYAVRQLLLSAAGIHILKVEVPPRQQWNKTAAAAVPEASLRDISQVLWAVVVMQLELPAEWWQQCHTQLSDLLQQHWQNHSSLRDQQESAQSLAVAVWALGLSRVRVSPQLWDLLQQASRQLLQDSSVAFRPEGHVMLLLGFTRMCTSTACRFERSSRYSDRVQQYREQLHSQQLQAREISAHERSRSCSSSGSVKELQDVCSHGLGPQPEQQQQQQQHKWVIRAGLSSEWLQQWCTSAQSQLQHLPPHGLVGLLWALGRLRYHPGSEFLGAAVQRLLVVLPQCSARHLALGMWSLRRLQHVPDEAMVQQVLAAWEPLIATASKADTQQMCWALEQLSQRTPSSNNHQQRVVSVQKCR